MVKQGLRVLNDSLDKVISKMERQLEEDQAAIQRYTIGPNPPQKATEPAN